MSFNWPKDGKLEVPLTNRAASARLLAAPQTAFAAEPVEGGVQLTVTGDAPGPDRKRDCSGTGWPGEGVPQPVSKSGKIVRNQFRLVRFRRLRHHRLHHIPRDIGQPKYRPWNL